MPRQRTVIDDFLDGLREMFVEYASDFVEEKINPPKPPRAPRPRRAPIKAAKTNAPKTPKPAKRERAEPTHYETLQVARNADAETISAAYRSLCKRAHPDNWPSAKDEHRRQAGEFRMKLYTEAFAVLKDPIKRKEYDREIR